MRAGWRTTGLLLVAAVPGLVACGGGPDPTSQQLGGPAAADLAQAWQVTLDVVEVEPPAIEAADEERSRTYRFSLGDCPDAIEVEPHADGEAPAVSVALRSETDPDGCLGSGALEVAGGTVSGVPFVAIGETRFRMAYEAEVPCLDDAGTPVEDLAQHHELVWELEAADAPERLTGELVRTIRTDPGCAPPAGQPSATVERLEAVPAAEDDG